MPRFSDDDEHKFGKNPDVDSAAPEDIWDGGGDYVFPTQARIHNLVSSDAVDDGKATGTLTLVSAIATDVAVVNGLSYLGVAGVPANFTEFSIDTSDTAAAASLAAAINGDTRPGVTVPTAVVVASSAVGVVTINVDGAIGNLVDISSVDSTITASASTLADVGTGAHTVFIEGLGPDYLEITETVYLNGTVAVPTTKEFLRINRMYVVIAGSGDVNAGVITATAVTDATVSAQISIGVNQTLQAIYTVPADADLMLNSYYFSIGKFIATEIDGSLLIREFGEVFQTKHTIGGNSVGTTNPTHNFTPKLLVHAKSDIKLRASVTTNNSVVYGGFDGDFSRPQVS